MNDTSTGNSKKVWVAKYALTRGIFSCLAEVKGSNSNNYAYVHHKGRLCYLSPRDFFHTKKEAVLAAEKLRAKKVENLKNQIQKLEKKKF